ncbi:rhomboid family intramembrane serine protease [Paucihalobacter sp.]|uniref:rhomboid family intramembrane serine protease n=2 Tax=Paucihalobacter sp. TaxID=2850405 RepID=UPI003D162131
MELMKNFDDLKYKYSQLNVFEKIIVINGIIFIIGLLLGVAKISFLKDWFALPSQFSDFLWQPWSILTYGFLHGGLFHVLFNMLFLYYFARILLNLLNVKMVLNVYLLGIISGGLAFLAIYNLVPRNYLINTSSLVGASAGIRALLVFIVIYLPYTQIRIFTFNVKLLYVMYVIMFFDLVGLAGTNQGGNVAHFGGYLLGFIYAKQLQKGNDIGLGFQKFMDYLLSYFQSSPKKASRMKTVHKSKSKNMAGVDKKEFNSLNKQKQIDVILDKISKSGYDSLSAEEKEFLFKAGKD